MLSIHCVSYLTWLQTKHDFLLSLSHLPKSEGLCGSKWDHALVFSVFFVVYSMRARSWISHLLLQLALTLLQKWYKYIIVCGTALRPTERWCLLRFVLTESDRNWSGRLHLLGTTFLRSCSAQIYCLMLFVVPGFYLLLEPLVQPHRFPPFSENILSGVRL